MGKPTISTLFSGAGGVDLGAIAAGFEPCESVEYDPQLAELHKANIGGKCHVMNILDASPYKFEKMDLLHASPPCPNFSTAKKNASELQQDRDFAHKIADFIEVLEPPTFTLENVQAYAKSFSLQIILEALYSNGYWVNYQVLNAADFGVPQSRRRLILIAVKSGFIPSLPPKENHIGWYEAIADLVHDLPDSKLADWQLKALPMEIREHLLVSPKKDGFYYTETRIERPVTRSFDEVSPCLLADMPLKAILIENTGARSDRPLQTKQATEPCWTLRSLGQDGHWHRANALLIHPTDQRTMPVIEAADPAFTATANQGGNHIKALLENAKIKALDIPCLARLQSFPDDYKWSGKKSLDGKGIGNSVPPLMYEKILRSVYQQELTA
jgi:DNA (cytosine-5)-methyltransferase 1